MKSDSLQFKRKYLIVINVIIGIYTLKIIWEQIEHFLNGLNYNNPQSSWYIGEFLINYKGGFVRRGLLGEIIYRCATSFNINPQLFVGIFCSICFLIVTFFFIVQFKRNKICWWLLPLNILLANLDIIRKDYFFVVSLIAILYCYKSNWNRIVRIVLINIITIITLLSHEAFFFYCVPLLCWVLLRDDTLFKRITPRVLYCVPIIIAMLLVTLFHGNSNISQIIANSWVDILQIEPNQLIPQYTDGSVLSNSGAIGALSWKTDNTLFYHFKQNFFEKSFGIPGFIIRPLTIIIVFYFLLNYILTFSTITNERSVFFTRILIIQFISLLPLFTVLSCDTSRIYFYWITSSFVFFFLLNDNTEIKPVFKRCLSLSNKIHLFFTVKLKAPIWLLLFILFTLCIPYNGNDLSYTLDNNIINHYFRLVNIVITSL